MLYIVFISAIVFLFGGVLMSRLAFHPTLIFRGEVWRLITWVFLPVSNQLFFVLIALYFYYFIGSTLEREWGTPKFTVFYLSGIILNIIYGFVAWFFIGRSISIVPYYVNLSMLFAFAVLFPDHTVRLFFVIPIKVKWLAIFNAVYFLYEIMTGILAGSLFAALLPVVALLNYILICGDELLAYIRPYKTRSSPPVVNFRKAAKKAKRDLDDKPYRHKCSVCGRTDTEYPGLEFRYCSQCEGYHCFCIDHINNHIHFK